MGKNSKDKRDVYNRLAKESNYRARSVYKLLQVNEEMHLLDNATNVVDLCAAPGSWSQALQKILSSNSDHYKIVSVDLQKIEPIEGVVTLIGDITKESTAKEIIANFDGKLADVVVCDGAADITGIHSLDESFHYFIFTAAMAITSHLLKEGGHFAIKIFQGIHSNCILRQLSSIFEEVRIIKPLASRQASAEAFLVAKNYNPPRFFKADLSRPDRILLPQDELSLDEKQEIKKAANLLKYVMYGGYNSVEVNQRTINDDKPIPHNLSDLCHGLDNLELENNNNSPVKMDVNTCINDIRNQSIKMVKSMHHETVDDSDEFNNFFNKVLTNHSAK